MMLRSLSKIWLVVVSFACHYLASMARFQTCFFHQISWASGIHMEVFFTVYHVRVLPCGRYPLGWVLCTWEISTSVGFFPVAIPSQVWVPETNTPSWRYCCQLVPGKVRLHNLLSSAVSWYILDVVRGVRILGACLCDGMLGNAWSNSQPNFGCLVSNNIWIVLDRCGTVANGNACPFILCALSAHCWLRQNEQRYCQFALRSRVGGVLFHWGFFGLEQLLAH